MQDLLQRMHLSLRCMMVKIWQRIQFLARYVNDDNKRNVMIHTFQTVLTLLRWHSCNLWTFARLENIKNCNCILVSSIYPAKSSGSVWLQVIFTYLSALRLNVIQCGAMFSMVSNFIWCLCINRIDQHHIFAEKQDSYTSIWGINQFYGTFLHWCKKAKQQGVIG